MRKNNTQQLSARLAAVAASSRPHRADQKDSNRRRQEEQAADPMRSGGFAQTGNRFRVSKIRIKNSVPQERETTVSFQTRKSGERELVLSLEWQSETPLFAGRALRVVRLRAAVQLHGSQYSCVRTRSLVHQHRCDRFQRDFRRSNWIVPDFVHETSMALGWLSRHRLRLPGLFHVAHPEYSYANFILISCLQRATR